MCGKAFYDKKDDKLFFKCKRFGIGEIGIGENYIVDLDNADGYNGWNLDAEDTLPNASNTTLSDFGELN